VEYREHAPSPALRRIVACYWTLRSAPGARSHRVLPDGCLDLLFDLARPSASVVGVMTRAIVAPAAPASFFGVRFQPGEAPSVLGLDGRETRDELFGIADAWGPLGRELSDRVLSAPSSAARIREVEAALLAHGARARAPDPRVRSAVEMVRASRGAIEVASLARAVQLGERQLERAFDQHVGLGPKAFARVMRLQAVRAALARGVPSWAALAAELGFADQAHLAREVRALAGVTPGELVRERGMSDSFNPLPEEPLTVGA
jgi:AraC-like DNA-binding protein